MVVTTVVEHHANLLPWARLATLMAGAGRGSCPGFGYFFLLIKC